MNHTEIKLARQFQIPNLPLLGTTMNKTMRLENSTTKKFKREKWLLVCETESYKNISQIKKIMVMKKKIAQ